MNKTRLVPLVTVALTLACSTDPSVDVGGQWDWAATFTSTSPPVTCVTSGSILLAQSSGGALSGLRSNTVVECEGGPDNLEQSLLRAANVIRAEVQGDRITMEIDFCEFEGTVRLDTLEGDVMSGTVQCQEGLVGIDQGVFTGTWQASR